MERQQQLSDEILMAYADGELDAETARSVEAAAATDPEIAQRIALFSRTGDLLGAAGRARPLETLPDSLVERVRQTLDDARSGGDAKVLPFPARTASQPQEDFLRYGLAASIALAVGLAAGYLLPRGGGEAPGGALVAALEAPAVTQALAALPSGQRQVVSGGEIEIIATFTNTDAELCREFEYGHSGATGLVSVACLSGDQWQTRFAVVGSVTDSTGYVPASSLDALDAYLTAIGADAPMSADEEAAALAGLR